MHLEAGFDWSVMCLALLDRRRHLPRRRLSEVTPTRSSLGQNRSVTSGSEAAFYRLDQLRGHEPKRTTSGQQATRRVRKEAKRACLRLGGGQECRTPPTDKPFG